MFFPTVFGQFWSEEKSVSVRPSIFSRQRPFIAGSRRPRRLRIPAETKLGRADLSAQNMENANAQIDCSFCIHSGLHSIDTSHAGCANS